MRVHVQEWHDDGFERHADRGHPERKVREGLDEHLLPLANGLDQASRPAIALLDEVDEVLRSVGPGDGLVLVEDFPPRGDELEGEVGIFGKRIRVVAADLFEGLPPEDAHGPGDDVHRSDETLRPAGHVEPLDVFECLKPREQSLPVGHLHIAGHRTHRGVGETTHGGHERPGIHPRIRIHAEDERVSGLGDSDVQRRGLAAVPLRDQAHVDATPAAFPSRGDLCRIVRRAVIHDHDLEHRIVHLEKALDRRIENCALVVGRHDDGDRGQFVRRLAPSHVLLRVLQVAEPEEGEVPHVQDRQEDDQADHHEADHEGLNLEGRRDRPQDEGGRGADHEQDQQDRDQGTLSVRSHQRLTSAPTVNPRDT